MLTGATLLRSNRLFECSRCGCVFTPSIELAKQPMVTVAMLYILCGRLDGESVAFVAQAMTVFASIFGFICCLHGKSKGDLFTF